MRQRKLTAAQRALHDLRDEIARLEVDKSSILAKIEGLRIAKATLEGQIDNDIRNAASRKKRTPKVKSE